MINSYSAAEYYTTVIASPYHAMNSGGCLAEH